MKTKYVIFALLFAFSVLSACDPFLKFEEPPVDELPSDTLTQNEDIDVLEPQTLEEILVSNKDLFGMRYQDVVAKMEHDNWALELDEEELNESGAYSKQFEEAKVLLVYEVKSDTIASMYMNVFAKSRESLFTLYQKVVELLGPEVTLRGTQIPFVEAYIAGLLKEWEYDTYDSYLTGLTSRALTMMISEAMYESEDYGLFLTCYSGETNVEGVENLMSIAIIGDDE